MLLRGKAVTTHQPLDPPLPALTPGFNYVGSQGFVYEATAVPEAIAVAEAARRRVFENFGLAILYNSVSIPFAVMGYVSPLLAAAVMSTSSILVTLNALRLRGGSKPWTS